MKLSAEIGELNDIDEDPEDDILNWQALEEQREAAWAKQREERNIVDFGAFDPRPGHHCCNSECQFCS